MQTLSNPYTGESLMIDPRNLAQRILEVRAKGCMSVVAWALPV
jgi:hypothetical protein